jgi:phage terminase large subunit
MKLELKGNPYPKQIEFFQSRARYTAYGGARGGGKSWAARRKALLLCLRYEGMQILFLRRKYTDLKENHLLPMQSEVKGAARFDSQSKAFIFPNDSRLKFGYCDNEGDVLQYQGQAYDVIFMEEATQFTEFMYQTLTECNRSSGMMKEKFSPRMYFTCNPGGVGHAWVKRLFIEKNYRNKEKRDNLSIAGKSRAQLFDWKVVAEQIYSVYEMSIVGSEKVRLASDTRPWNRFLNKEDK